MNKKRRPSKKKLPLLVLFGVVFWAIASTSYNIYLFNMWYGEHLYKVVFVVFFFMANTAMQIASRLEIFPVDPKYTRSACAIEKLLQLAALWAEYLRDDGKVIPVLFFTIVMLGLDKIFVRLINCYKKEIRAWSGRITKKRRIVRPPTPKDGVKQIRAAGARRQSKPRRSNKPHRSNKPRGRKKK